MDAMGAYKCSWFCVLLLLTIPAYYAQNQTEDTSTDSITQNHLNQVSVSLTAAVSQTDASTTQPTESTTSKPTETESFTALPTTKPTTSQATETFPPTTEASTTAIQTVTSANET